MPTPEQEARETIDALLDAAGWCTQDRAALNFGAALGVAVREFPLQTGFADYLLFVDRKAVGVVEAKAAGTTLSGVADQSAAYLTGMPHHTPRTASPSLRLSEHRCRDLFPVRAQGREPEHMATEALGFDVLSTGPDGTRYFEVKGWEAVGTVALTWNECIEAGWFEADYWLYVAIHCKSELPLCLLQNPAGVLRPEEKFEIVCDFVWAEAWHRHAQLAGNET